MKAEVEFLDLEEAWRQDERGWVYFPFQHLDPGWSELEILQSLHVIAITPGQIRGQHLHPQKTEWLYLISGQGTLFWRDEEDFLQRRELLANRQLVIIPPGIPHALRNDGPEVLYLLAWRASPKLPISAPDTVPAPLI